MSRKKVVLAYSGGLDTSVILKWLDKEKDMDVIAYIADVGQQEELEQAREKAIKTGAYKVYIEDLKEEFVQEAVFRAVKANAIYEDKYLLGTSLARPIIAKRQVEIAKKEGASAVAHGATGKGNDQVRFELTYYALAPELEVIAPWREWSFKGRNDLIEYAKKNGIDVSSVEKKPYSMDRNAMHISYEGGILEDLLNMPDDSMFVLTKSPQEANDKGEVVKITFEKGIPVAVNGEALSPYNIVAKLNEIGGRNAIGRVDIVENRLVGIKSRGVYETPGVSLLIYAHRELESIILDKDSMHFKQLIGIKYSELIYNGMWFSPLKNAIDSFIDSLQEDVNGDIELYLYKGNIMVKSRKAIRPLYDPNLASFEGGDYDHNDAKGFIRLFGLQLREYAKLHKGV